MICPKTCYRSDKPICSCRPAPQDPERDQVVALSEAGVDYLTACRAVWAPDLLDVAVPVVSWADYVRTQLLLRLPWLRLPVRAEAGEIDEGGLAFLCVLGAVLVLGWAILGGHR